MGSGRRLVYTNRGPGLDPHSNMKLKMDGGYVQQRDEVGEDAHVRAHGDCRVVLGVLITTRWMLSDETTGRL